MRLRTSLIAVLFLLSAYSAARAAKLDAFEEDITTRKDGVGVVQPSDGHSCSCLNEVLSDILNACFDGTRRSSTRSIRQTESTLDLQRREPGNPLLPIVKFDAAWRYIDSDVFAIDYRIESGFGPLAVSADLSRYKESDPGDSLTLSHVYCLLRMSATDQVEFDLGMGSVMSQGNDFHSGASWTACLRWQILDPACLDLCSQWGNINGNAVVEWDLGIVLGSRWLEPSCPAFCGLKLGYRFVEGPTHSLNGPYAGISLRL